MESVDPPRPAEISTAERSPVANATATESANANLTAANSTAAKSANANLPNTIIAAAKSPDSKRRADAAERSGAGSPKSPAFRTVAAPGDSPRRRRRHSSPAKISPLHSGKTLPGIFASQFFSVIFPISAGLLLYGWRAAASVGIVVASAAVGYALWRNVGSRGRQLTLVHCLWMATLLAMALPAHLCSTAVVWHIPTGWHVWPLLPAAGLLVVMMIWLLGGLGSGRVHPMLVTYLLLFTLFEQALTAHRILESDHVLTGDIMDATMLAEGGSAADTAIDAGGNAGRAAGIDARGDAGGNAEAPISAPWYSALARTGAVARYIVPACERLTPFTTGRLSPDRGELTVQTLVRDQMPPLENLIVGGDPGPIGASSALALIIGGLYLLYRGLIDYKIPLLICVSAWVTILILPIPVFINEAGPAWHWLALRQKFLGWPIGLTFADYEIVASPLVFMAFYVATAPSIRPMTRRGRILYAICAGVFSAFFQLYATVAAGPYIALLIVSLLTPTLDAWFSPRPLA